MVCTAVGAGLTWGAYDFVVQETWSQVSVAGMPIWVVETIFPLTFAVLTLRFIARAKGVAARSIAALGLLVALGVGFGFETLSGTVAWIGLVLLFVAFTLGAPIFVLLGGAAALMFAKEGVPAAAIHVEAYRRRSRRFRSLP
jgi:hypothetical protein